MSELEVCCRQHRGGGEGDAEVGDLVAVEVGEDDCLGVGREGAQFATGAAMFFPALGVLITRLRWRRRA